MTAKKLLGMKLGRKFTGSPRKRHIAQCVGQSPLESRDHDNRHVLPQQAAGQAQERAATDFLRQGL